MHLDEKWMKTAINLASAAQGQTSPNPAVGSVVVKDGRVVGMGAHLKPGEAHAEVYALQMAGSHAEGSTIYVTLEPCSHFGKTPPCADLIIEKKVKRVVIGSVDPNPKVSGTGIGKLKKAGIDVTTGVCQTETDKLNEYFFYAMKYKKPFITLKTAMSLDGKTATNSGHSKWVTGRAAREDVHRDRHMHDAILVGVNTVKRDNPSLTVRLPEGGVSPKRVILDTKLTIPLQSKLLHDGEAEVFIICGRNADKEKERELNGLVNVNVCRMNQESIQVQSVLTYLFKNDIHSVYVEGGSEIHASFIEAKAVNRFITYIAPKLITGRDAKGVIGGNGIQLMDEAFNLTIEHVEMIGSDIKVIASPKGDE
ncbi:bifunctional diaminohydroxyphosphoribosylaminopyrimidine deaminase/5-amino-6-(5-phosphoribosylamino)uracil reductase RibD [Jeotgalibacillus haloalkalitolerans]|uniref:Riboflavin biosynthesis protein RibD n=1 Tax=Jeotgalibacillus haloalkalitolerans TaxID=3104292 RepID=A0ABU5KKX9_9BACL|nr:bifunctional diaminohydroxyphosphoribosylaminopyrimidine deaminase/5-amino-6-(5-phosphoribosylamino)uracil reductase RibD [Jeotgalibacillus sp. HH7-29]MDZ5711920.1 bifunctional diaminohydroxyphosphoribosylaminopyrimidine deaminase/5-amino-6-(5-phosphoribosylamino)uracil reductase RibD [Jeotgalibacillus sp. HH7-29]